MLVAMALAVLVGASPAGGRDQEWLEAPPPPEAQREAEDPPPEPVESRIEEWTRRRREQLSSLEPYRPGWLERNLLAIEKAERPSILDFNYRGFYPRIQSIASGSRNAMGVRFWQPSIDGSGVSAHGSAFYSLAKYQFYDFQLGRIPHAGEAFPLRSIKGDDVYELGQLGRPDSSKLILYGTLRHLDYTQLTFFGLGPGSRPEDETNYRLQDSLYEVVAGYQFNRRLAFTLRGGYLHSTVKEGTEEGEPTTQQLFDEAGAPGLTDQPDYWLLTAQLFLDFRDVPGNPHRGAMLAAQYTLFEDRKSSAFRFDRLGLDARAYLSLGSPQRVLALRGYLIHDDAAAGSRVPFYLQEFLGGSHTLRGFENFRFRGTELALFQAEYRWEPAPALELVLFADAGRVGNRAAGLDFSDFKTDWGFGLRIKSYRAVMIRADFARSEEGSRFFLRFSPSF